MVDPLLGEIPGGWASFVRDKWQREPVVFRGLLRAPERLERLLYDANVRAGVAASRRERSGLRFVAGEGASRTESESFIDRDRRLQRKDGGFDGFVDRASRACGRRDVTLILNHSQAFNRQLYDTAREFLRGLYRIIGSPVVTDAVSYMSRVRTSALGIHRDLVDNFIFVARGEKRFSLWSPETEGTGEIQSKRSFASMRKLGTHIALRAGDALYLPRGYYHLGRQDGLAIHLALTIGTEPAIAEEFIREALRPFWMAAFASEQSENFARLDDDLFLAAALPAMFQRRLHNGFGKLRELERVGARVTKMSWLRRASAAGFQYVPERRRARPIRVTDTVVGHGDRIFAGRRAKVIVCGIDGHGIQMPGHEGAIAMLRELRRGQPVSVRSLVDRFTGVARIGAELRELDQRWMLKLLSEIHRAGGLDVVKSTRRAR